MEIYNMKFYSKLLIFPVLLMGYACGNENTDETEDVDSENENHVELSASDTITNVIEGNIAEDVDNEKFKSLIDEGQGLILDVRTAEEYAEGHIEGALNMDFHSTSFTSDLDTLDKSVPVYVYCHGGGRSGQTKNMLAEKGFSAVYNLQDGFGKWPY